MSSVTLELDAVGLSSGVDGSAGAGSSSRDRDVRGINLRDIDAGWRRRSGECKNATRGEMAFVLIAVRLPGQRVGCTW